MALSEQERDYWRDLLENGGDDRPPAAQNEWYSVNRSRYSRLEKRAQRDYNHARLIHEEGFGEMELDPCVRCKRLGRECWRFKKAVQQALGFADRCSSCSLGKTKCQKGGDVTEQRDEPTSKVGPRLDDRNVSATYQGKRRGSSFASFMAHSRRSSRSSDANVEFGAAEPLGTASERPQDRLVRESFSTDATRAPRQSRPRSVASDDSTNQRPRYPISEAYINELEDRNSQLEDRVSHLKNQLELQHAQHVGITTAFKAREQGYRRRIEEYKARIEELTLNDRIEKAEAELQSMKRKREALRARDEGLVASQRSTVAKRARHASQSHPVLDSAEEDDEMEDEILSS